MTTNIKTGYILGTGAAINKSLGFKPDYVKVTNAIDGDKITEYFSDLSVAFTSGGTTEIAAGDTITGATSGVTAQVKDVLLASGSWAGGDAAGFFIIDADDVSGTFGSENVDVGSNTNLATVAAQKVACVDIDTEVAAATGNAAITAYAGSSSASAGFTIGSTVSESGKLLRFVAVANSN